MDNTTRLALKVDIDTKVGLTEGARNLAAIMADLGVEATFYITMGPDNSGRALKRIFRPGFLKKQLNSNAAGAFGLRTMLYGVLLPAPIIASSAPTVFHSLLNQGHEIGLHGWDHVYWHDYMRRLPAERVVEELRKAADLFLKITGMRPASFASPGWQITNSALSTMEQMGITHVGCGRGETPFRPVVDGRTLNLIEFPTNMPTTDELMGHGGVTANQLAGRLYKEIKPGRLNVFTLHGEVEGRILKDEFRGFLQKALESGVVVERLVDAANRISQETVPSDEMVWGGVEARAYEVGWQKSALERL